MTILKLLDNVRKYAIRNGYYTHILIEDEEIIEIAFTNVYAKRTAFVVQYRKFGDINVRWELTNFYQMFETSFTKYERLMKCGIDEENETH